VAARAFSCEVAFISCRSSPSSPQCAQYPGSTTAAQISSAEPAMAFSSSDYEALARPRYGSTNPEKIDNPMWLAAISSRETAYQIRRQQNDTDAGDGVGSGLSSYREQSAGPVWTWERFGRTTTRLADGRMIHVGGEHEDWYDIDFC